VRCRVDFAVADILVDKGTLNIVDEVEKNTSAYLAVDSDGFLEICGTNMAVALATSRLDEFLHSAEQTKTDFNDNQSIKIKYDDVNDAKEKKIEVDEPEVIWKRREITPKVKPPKKEMTEIAKDNQRTSVQDENNDNKTAENKEDTDKKVDNCLKDETNSSLSEELNCKSEESASSSTNSLTEEHGQGHVSSSLPNALSGESLRDFALKLQYSESEVSSALSKLGPEADTNLLLMELVKARNSAKQIEEGSSVIERPSSTPPISCSDPNTLRPIVIDGSNLAMRYVLLYFTLFSRYSN